MPLSKNVRRELQRELQEARASRDHAIARMRALEAILGDSYLDREPELTVRVRSVEAVKVAQPSLRAAVLKRLEDGSSVAIDVARHLESQGFRVGGTTSLRERVAHELSRLRRKGVVRRNRNGQYELLRRELSPLEVGSEATASEEQMALNGLVSRGGQRAPGDR